MINPNFSFKFWFVGLINLRRGELCSPAKSIYTYISGEHSSPLRVSNLSLNRQINPNLCFKFWFIGEVEIKFILVEAEVFRSKPFVIQNFSPITICNANKHLKPIKIAANKWSRQPLRPNKVAKALGFAHFDPVRILKMRTAEGVPRGTPIGGFFGSFLVRTRNERIILKQKWAYIPYVFWTLGLARQCPDAGPYKGYGLIGI